MTGHDCVNSSPYGSHSVVSISESPAETQTEEDPLPPGYGADYGLLVHNLIQKAVDGVLPDDLEACVRVVADPSEISQEQQSAAISAVEAFKESPIWTDLQTAAAVYTEAGQAQVRALIDHYMGNAKLLREAAANAGLEVFGGTNAPYIWVKTPNGIPSWDIFDKVLNEAAVGITPGAGFGTAGEGYFRISAFNSRANSEEVAGRIGRMMW